MFVLSDACSKKFKVLFGIEVTSPASPSRSNSALIVACDKCYVSQSHTALEVGLESMGTRGKHNEVSLSNVNECLTKVQVMCQVDCSLTVISCNEQSLQRAVDRRRSCGLKRIC